MHPILSHALVAALVADRRGPVHRAEAAAGSSRPRVRGSRRPTAIRRRFLP
jgi:hypothetical protein